MRSQQALRILKRAASALALILVHTTSVLSQSNCTGEAPQGTWSVAHGRVVYYKVDASVTGIDSSGSGYTPQTQITKAFESWNDANQASGDNTTFLPADSDHPAVVTVTANFDSYGTAGAETGPPDTGTITPLNKATVTLFPNATNSLGAFYQSQQPGYDSVYWQVMLHEIGHLLGFGDYPKPYPPHGPNASAMNNASGINGTDQTPPTLHPTACDVSTAAQYGAAITYTSPSSGGGGGGGPKGGGTVPVDTAPGDGSGGGGGISCQWHESFDDNTNTVTTVCS